MFKQLNKIFIPANILIIICASVILGAFIFYKVPDNLSPKEYEVELTGKIMEYPDVRSDKTILTIKSLTKLPGSLNGRVRVSANSLEDYSYGEYIIVTGTMKEPKNFSNFNWVGYLAKENIQYVMNMPEIKKTKRADRDVFYFARSVRKKLQDGINNSLLPPHSTLYSAMILANKGGFSPAQRENLAASGLSHIVAISGMHIAVVAFLLFFTLTWLGLWRGQASIATLFVLAFYIFMIGAPASAVRAGIMAGVLIAAQIIGRPNSPWRALFLAAAIMVLFNPYIVRYDAGFQLSFLAVAGILLLYRRIEFYLRKFQHYFVGFITRRPPTKDRVVAIYAAESKFGFVSILAVTLSAQVFTFPLLIYNFGNFSFFSPLANLLAIPVLPAVIISGFVSAIGGMLNGIFTQAFAAPAWLLSEYIWQIVNLFS